MEKLWAMHIDYNLENTKLTLDHLINIYCEKCCKNICDEEIKDHISLIQSTYYMMKSKFRKKYRDDGTRYFEHIKYVTRIILDDNIFDEITFEKVIVAILHDSIEDVGKSFEWIKEDYWYKIALWVKALSKDDISFYLTQEEQLLPQEEQEKIWKPRMRKKYYKKYESIKNMQNYIKKLWEKYNIPLTQEELEEISIIVFEVKFADRIHNLSTQWDPNNLEKVKRKIKETHDHFLKTAKIISPKSYEILKDLILELQIKLMYKEVNWIIELEKNQD